MMQISVRKKSESKVILAIFLWMAISIIQLKSQEQKSSIIIPKESKSGNIIRPDSLLAQRSMTLVDILKGQLAGVKASSADGAPGAAFDLYIRGINSVRGDNQPLIIVDGVMLNPANLEVMNSWKALDGLDYQSNQNLLGGINTEDIAQIEVLKDASATAMYGSKGANGVIIIKTKVGNKSKMSLKWSSNIGFSMLSKQLDFLAPDNYLNYRTKLGNTLNTAALQPADWQNLVFQTAISNNHNLNLSGTVRNTSYYVSLFLKDEEGIIKGTNARDWGFQANLNQNLNDKIQLRTSVVFTNNTTSMNQSNSYVGAPGLVNQLAAAPYYGLGDNAMSWLYGYNDDVTTWRLRPSMNFKVQFTPSFSFLMNAGADYANKTRFRWMGTEIERGLVSNARAGLADYTAINLNTNIGFSYNRIFDNKNLIKINLSGGYFGNSNDATSIQSTNFFTYILGSKGINLGSNMVGPTYSGNSISTAYANADAVWVYKNLVEINGGVRADYLAEYDEKPSYFPFLQGKWNISNNSFFKYLKNTFSNLSIKGGYGVSGTNSVDLYADADKYTLGQSTLLVPWENSLNYRVRLQTQKKEFNVGVEAAMLNKKLTLGISLYKGSVEDAFAAYDFTKPVKVLNADSSISVIAATKHFWQNKMKLDKQGFEISASMSLIKKKNFEWNASANLTVDRSKVIDCGSNSYLGSTGGFGFTGAPVGILAGDVTYVTAFVNNKAPGVFYGYLTQGILSTDHETLTPPLKGQRLYAGDVKYLDLNGNGQTEAGDKGIIGNPNPDFTYALNSDIRYKNWTAKVSFDGSVGNQVLNLNKLMTDNVNSLNNISSLAYNNAWVSGEVIGKSPRIGATSLNEISDRLVEDGSYLRLSTLTVGYNIPVKKLKFLTDLTINLVATNLFVISPYSGYNPDVNSFSGNWSIRGIDSGAYPMAKLFSFGFVAKF